jgi:hypothetical protein
VSLGNIWRLIAMPADSTLGDLVTLILESVRFDDDHLYEITCRDRRGCQLKANHPRSSNGGDARAIPRVTLVTVPAPV